MAMVMAMGYGFSRGVEESKRAFVGSEYIIGDCRAEKRALRVRPEDESNRVRDGSIDVTRIDMPSFHAFKQTLLAAI